MTSRDRDGKYQRDVAAVDGARKEIWAHGLRNPHRLLWDVDPARSRTPTLLAFDI